MCANDTAPACPKHDTYMVPSKFQGRLGIGQGGSSMNGFKCPNPDCQIVYIKEPGFEGFYSLEADGRLTSHPTFGGDPPRKSTES